MNFSLFPPCFQQQKRIDPIHAVIRAASFWKVLDKNAGILPFIKKKVEGFSLHSTNRFRAAIYFFQSGMNRLKVFNTGSPLFSGVEKAGKSAVFHTGKVPAEPSQSLAATAPPKGELICCKPSDA